jgi:hypothetical protein
MHIPGLRVVLVVTSCSIATDLSLAQEQAPRCFASGGTAQPAAIDDHRAATHSFRSPAAALELIPSRGIAGSGFIAVGVAPEDARGTRLFWSERGTTQGLAESPTEPGSEFRILASVPAVSEAGPHRVCATPVGARPDPRTASCAVFVVEPTPPGSVSGVVYTTSRDGSRSPSPDTEVRLTKSSGVFVARTRTNERGEYTFREIEPGNYIIRPQKEGVAFVGEELTLPPGANTGIDIVEQVVIEFPVARVEAVGAVVLPVGPITQSGYKLPIPIFDLDRERDGGYWARFAHLPGRGVDLSVRFYAESTTFFSSSTDRAIRFEFFENGKLRFGSTAHAPEPVFAGDPQYNFLAYSRTFNVSHFGPGDLTLRVTPEVDGIDGPSREHLVRFVDLDSRWFNQHLVAPPAKLVVRPGFPEVEYQFIGNAARPMLPVSEPIDVKLEKFDNVFDAAAEVRETFHTRDGFTQAAAIMDPEVTVFDKKLISGDYPYGTSFDGSGLPSYQIPNFTAAGPVEFAKVPLYENGPGIGCFDPCFIGSCDICAGWRIWADVTIAGQIDLASQIQNQLAYSFDVTPFASATVGGHAEAELVFCSASGNITGTAQIGLPLHYDNHVPTAELQSPCVKISGTLDAQLGCFGFELGGDGSVGPYSFGNCPESTTLPAVPSASDAARHYRVDASPSVAAAEDGKALAVWVEPQAGPFESLSPRLMSSHRGAGGWSAASPVAPEPAAINNPRVVYLADGRALAIWAQNRATLAEIARQDGAEIGKQEIAFALWDGEGWSEARNITDDHVADGMPALAALPDGGAIAAWVRKTPAGRTPSEDDPIGVVTARFDGVTWGEITSLRARGDGIDSQVSLAVSQSGAAWASYLRDADQDLTTVSDRELWVAELDGRGSEQLSLLTGAPEGAFSPEIALDPQGKAWVVFLVPPRTSEHELTDGFGSASAVWVARKIGDSWRTSPVSDALRGADPQFAITPSGLALISLRGFVDSASDSQYGEIFAAVARTDSDPLNWSVGSVSGDGQTNWQSALALDPAGVRALLVNVKQSPHRDPRARLMPPVAAIAAGVRATALDALDSRPTVVLTEMSLGSDLAIDRNALSFSNDHPRSGEAIQITADVTGSGLGNARDTAALVEFFAQEQSGRPARKIGERRIAPPLRFSDHAQATIDYLVPARGEVAISAVVQALDDSPEITLDNNRAERTLGTPPAPRQLVVLLPPGASHPLLSWEPPLPADLPAAYTIYRSRSTDGVFEPIGTTDSTRFVDTLAGARERYFYRVSALDECAVESPLSEVAVAR